MVHFHNHYQTIKGWLPESIDLRLMLFIGLAVFLAINTETLPAADIERPNIVVIMADDLGYADLSCYGDAGYQTPQIDKLAREGLVFTDFHSNGAVCSPTRAALLTGRYQQRSGVDGVIFADSMQNRHHGLQPEETTFAEALKQVGYQTAIFGKWHLGYEKKYNPVHQGFDVFKGYVSGNVCFQSHLDRMGIEDWWDNDKLTPEAGYVTHLITKHALEFIDQNHEQPFCIYVAHECVHSPYQAPDDPPVRTLGKVGDIRANSRKDIRKAYAEMMSEMDRGVGEIVAKLQKLNIDDKTLVLFFSDNGANRNGRNTPWRGNKGTLFEGGHRVPCIAWQPGTISPGKTNTISATIDIMPTMLDLSGASENIDKPLDGVSLVPVLKGGELVSDRSLFWATKGRWAVRSGDWKLLVGQSPIQKVAHLFNLKSDPGEQTNLADKHPKRVQELLEEYHAWRAEINLTATRQPEIKSTSNK